MVPELRRDIRKEMTKKRGKDVEKEEPKTTKSENKNGVKTQRQARISKTDSKVERNSIGKRRSPTDAKWTSTRWVGSAMACPGFEKIEEETAG